MRSKSLKQHIEQKRQITINESLSQYVNDVNAFIFSGGFDKAISTVVKNLANFKSDGTYDRDRAVDVLYNLALKGTKAYNKANDNKYGEIASDYNSIYKLAKKLLVKIQPMVNAAYKAKK